MLEYFKKIRIAVETIELSLAPQCIARIPLTKGIFALVDEEHEHRVLQYRWYANAPQPEHIYAVADVDGYRVSLQRLIRYYTDQSRSLVSTAHVSFKNKCSLDCRAANLVERADRQSVMRNRVVKRTSSSLFKGLSSRKKANGSLFWSVSIRIDEGDLFLGNYDNELFAAAVYDAAATVFFDGSALLNCPQQPILLDAIDTVQQRYARFKSKQKLQAKTTSTE